MMATYTLPSLATCLEATSWRGLLLLTESHGLPCSKRLSKAQLITRLQQHLLQPTVLTTILAQQPPPVHTLLTALLHTQGAALAQPMLANYGAIQPVPDWRKGLASRYLQATPLQRLFALGLLYFDPPQAQPGRVQRIVLPAELLSILQTHVAIDPTPPPAFTQWSRPGTLPDLAWHLALWLATTAATPIPCRRGGWLPPTVLATLNARLGLAYTTTALRSERKAPYLAFLHYLAQAAGFATTQPLWTLTPTAWQWLAAPIATRWQQLWQAWCSADPALAQAFAYPVPSRGAACFPWASLTPTAHTRLLTQVGQLPTAAFTPLTHLIEQLTLHDLHGHFGANLAEAAPTITALCTGPLFWFGILAIATTEHELSKRPEEQAASRESSLEKQEDKAKTATDFADTPVFNPPLRTPHSTLHIRLTPQGAWLLGLPDWQAPSFPKPNHAKRSAREPDHLLIPPTIQPLHLARLAPLCQWTPPASPTPASLTVEQQLQLDPAQIGQAIANGLQPAQIFHILTEATGAAPSQRQTQKIQRWIQTGQAVRVRPLLVLETTDAHLMGQLRSRKLVRRHLDTLLSPTRSIVQPDGLAALVQTLRTLNLYTQLPASFTPTQPASAVSNQNSVGAIDADAISPTAAALDTAPYAHVLWLLVQIYQGLSAQVDLPLLLPPNLLTALQAQLTFTQQATAESMAQRVLEQLAAHLRGYLRLPTWRIVEPQGAVLATLQTALAAHPKPDLRIAYWAADDDHKLTRRITPYALETHNKVLYLIAYCHLREEERTFRVDRIESCEIINPI